MSWSARGEIVDGKLALKDVPPVPLEAQDQLDAATEAVLDIFASGAAGGAHHSYAVTLGGHANPNHEPAAGWANDGVTISISQLSDDPPAE